MRGHIVLCNFLELPLAVPTDLDRGERQWAQARLRRFSSSYAGGTASMSTIWALQSGQQGTLIGSPVSSSRTSQPSIWPSAVLRRPSGVRVTWLSTWTRRRGGLSRSRRLTMCRNHCMHLGVLSKMQFF